MSHWFEKYIVEVTAIFQSLLVIFSNSDSEQILETSIQPPDENPEN
jgi:hypothetical protein